MKPVFDKNGLASAAGDIRCFYYEAESGEYRGWSDEHIYVGVSMPENVTDIEPGGYKPGFVAVFNGTEWVQETDHRGETVYSTADGSARVVGYIGEIKEGFTAVAPLTPYDVWNGSEWVTDKDAQHAADVAAVEAEKQARIDRANSYINSKQWPGKAAMGRLKESEKEQYNLWLDYLDALEAVDTSSSPAITWPVKPVE
ncbi:tail assembly protein [Klebsiella sp. WP7-S18-CRE-02]|uniref:tail fiber assembly protein n=1 Tax=unclassified Klebsiella TaxID=2608929 RepID=UPI0015DC818A|nr:MULTISPECIES: tail fiber assembly protein [unclassified Klebsiella]BBS91715.1 tail assembly protein [Klebsiella sp. WP7-S18-CRE-02]BBS96737.1 tail assembly protein [Klebsiella sp. WP7-S18-CRE-03]BBT01769.1 tail assembly protein [Klebsiella sp. WP7-S18-ESBL-04]